MNARNKTTPSLELLQLLVGGWVQFDRNGMILGANTYTKQLLGHQSDTDLSGINFWDLICDASKRTQLRSALERFRRAFDAGVELNCVNANHVWVKLILYSPTPVDDSELVFECVLEEITELVILRREHNLQKNVIQKQRRLMDALGRIILFASVFQDLNSLLTLTCSEAVDLFGMSSAQVWLQGENNLVGLMSYGEIKEDIKGMEIPDTATDNVSIQALSGKIPVFTTSTHMDARSDRIVNRVILATPLLTASKAVGVLVLMDERTDHSFSGDDLEVSLQFGHQIAKAIETSQMVHDLQDLNQRITVAYDATLAGWARALELRDFETEGHTQRVSKIARELAQLCGMNDEALTQIYRGALLHDVGKMGIPDSILLKPGPLSTLESEIMRRHPTYAYEMLKSIEYLRPSLEIPLYHHEKWDGSGYPAGLKGEEIPLSARIFAIVDVWDALTSDRPYRPALDKEKALQYIMENSGKHFDPHIVEKFLLLVDNH
ncbi:MAG: hypothetical protein DPW18_09385 [Chloroflexi bacterium]|nr:hypothetical protein [Chloroflexota bacterium]MDL1943517.1 HD domain-containing protein [Chloroflexi bacterium CFX2]